MEVRIEAQKGICPKVIKKATRMIEQVEAGIIRPRVLTCNKAKVLTVGWYRAIKIPSKKSWLVCTHEKYNKLTQRGKLS